MRQWSFDRWTAATPLRNHARAAVRNGFAVVFLRPGGKEPLCPLTATERKKAGPHHPCGVAHASKDESWVLRKAKMLVEAHGQINLGIAAHASGVVVIDADTPEQVERVSDFLRELGDTAAILADQPTVKTPGAQRDGVWVHEQGTHWYFNRPDELKLPENPGHMVLPGGAVMRWGNSYTLVPPSERAEGPYVSLAEFIDDVPVGLASMILAHVHQRVDAAVDLMSRFHDDRIVEWSIRTPWHELLEPDGWLFMGKLDRQCGCPVWRRPGDDASTDRSAIAHEDDCGQMANVEGHGALHIFSDNPPGLLAERVAAGQRTFTKLQYVALMHYDGDETAAKVALGIAEDHSEFWGDREVPTEPREAEPEEETPRSEERGREAPPQDPPPTSATSRDDDWAEETHRALQRAGLDTPERHKLLLAKAQDRGVDILATEVARSVMARHITTSLWPTDEEVHAEWLGMQDTTVATHLFRTDNMPLLCAGAVNLVVARRGTGKTFLGQHTCLEIIDAGGRAAYLDLDDPTGSMRGRFLTMGRDLDELVRTGRFRRLNQQQIPAVLSVSMLDEYVGHLSSYDIVVFDVINHFIRRLGGDPNTGNQEVADLFDHLWNPLASAGVLVLLLSHPNRAGQEKGVDPAWVDPAGPAGIMNTLSGTGISMGAVRPFKKDDPLGIIKLFCRKARGGLAAEGDPLGTFRATSSIGLDTGAVCIDFVIEPPDDKTDEERQEEGTVASEDRIMEILHTRVQAVPMNRSDIKHLMSKAQIRYFDDAIARLLHQRRAVEVGQKIDLPPKPKPQGEAA